VKAYRLLRVIMNTAVEDGLVARNPCRIAGAGIERSPERPVATIQQVYELADAVGDRHRSVVLLATFGGLRLGELLALAREDLDLDVGLVRVRRQLHQLKHGELVFGAPKSDAGTRAVMLPAALIADLTKHLTNHVGPEPEALVFTGEKGGPLRRHVWAKVWDRARRKVGVPHLHFHDLRHAGNTLAAATGASTKELMARMGHASPEAALRHQHATRDRDAAIADTLSRFIESAMDAPSHGIDL
jgi:integrase